MKEKRRTRKAPNYSPEYQVPLAKVISRVSVDKSIRIAQATTLSWIEDQIQKSKIQKDKLVGTLRDVETEILKFRAAKID